MSLSGEVQSPDVKERLFRNLDAALDYCKFVQPKELGIKQLVVEGVTQWHLQFIGSEGMQ